MRFNTGGEFLRQASMGPAAIAARSKQIQETNLGIRPRPFFGEYLMRTGGSMGCCGLGDLAGNVPPPTILGPVAMRIINLRKGGLSPEAALMDALAMLHNQGMKTLTPEMHLQLAAGLQQFPITQKGLGSLGDSSTIKSGASSAITGASVGASAIGAGAASGLGIGAGLALGQTVIPIPVVGAAIGVIVWAVAHFSQRHVGKAEASWTSPGFYASLNRMNGRDYDEKQFSEAFKGMMDTGNNIVPGCGPDRHKDPDCLLGPMAAVIAQGYLSQAVPLTATTAQVFQTVVKPWLMSGAQGLVNARTLAGEPIQLLMMQAATDRYLAGQAMTRGDMPSYGQGAHTPTLVQALQPILQQPMTTTPQQQPSNAGGPVYLPAAPPTLNTQDPNHGGGPPINLPVGGGGMPTLPPQALPNYPPPMPYSGGGPAIGTQIMPGQSAPITQPGIPMSAAGFGGGLPTWLTIGIAVVGLGFVFFKQGPVKSSPNV